MQKKEERYISTSGDELFRRHYIPPGESGVRGIALFLHGLGDHGGRYERVLSRFLQNGIYCLAPDFPGHGHSGGTRGYFATIESIHALVTENLEHLRSTVSATVPAGLLGHSMGGFLALDYLSRSPQEFQFSWISSPLIDASWRRSRFLQLTAHILGSLAPRLSIHSGVHSNACKRDPERIIETKNDPLMHRRLTMRVGKLLLDQTSELPSQIHNLHPELRLLITHGSEDIICPSSLSKDLFERMKIENKSYRLLPGLLHEPFNDIGREDFYRALEEWIATTSLSHPVG